MKKSFIWPLANRISHVLLMVSFALAYTLGNYKSFVSIHVEFGFVVGVIFIFRILWGFIGPEHSKFRDFNLNMEDLKSYMSSVFVKTKEYAGHNPASSYATLAMMILAFLAIGTGALAYGIQDNHGIFAFLHQSFFKDMKIFINLHALFANMFIWVVIAHVAGSLIDKYIKKSDAIDSMISGYKKLSTKVDVKLNIAQKLFGIIWIVGVLFSLYYFLFTKDNIFVASSYVKQNYAALHKDFSNECGSCHITYPPYLLPKASWATMMKGLDNHFGEDASLDKTTNKSILAFLLKNSAENSTQKSAFHILQSLKGDKSTIAITKTPYWKHQHHDIKKEVFASNEVKSRANCSACHKDIQYGLLEDDLIKVPDIKG